ncbi:hypothetical protein AB0D34_46880 [Streptomyces sp. NPDC048420]|uniref:hypothetical protein n=1 Tax=Streptomyces sp. NPDC048420 TaxID=3155755 RepID=UPI003440013F
MILVVEGPSAAGKSTHCAQFASRQVVTELPGGMPSADWSLDETSVFWTERNVTRWTHACELEAEHELAVCDTDPLKLHYSWCLARAGLASADAFESQLPLARNAIETRRLGLADLITCQIPSPDTLRRQKEHDTTRSRRNFDVNAHLAGPLREWYQALDDTDPGRVMWKWSTEPSLIRRQRYDRDLFDAWMKRLPALSA